MCYEPVFLGPKPRAFSVSAFSRLYFKYFPIAASMAASVLAGSLMFL